MSPTRIEENNNNKEDSTDSFVLDSGANAHYYPTAFDEESPNNGSNQDNRITLADGSVIPTRRSQGNSEIVIAAFKDEFTRLISSGALVQQHEHPANLHERIAIDGRIRQT